MSKYVEAWLKCAQCQRKRMKLSNSRIARLLSHAMVETESGSNSAVGSEIVVSRMIFDGSPVQS
jgi:cytochrome c-type biogenesis protein CcmH/NrfF